MEKSLITTQRDFDKESLLKNASNIFDCVDVSLQTRNEYKYRIGMFVDFVVLNGFNHNSYLDLFALSALGYTNMHFLLSERTIKFIPFTISALSIGVIYIPQKKHLERRMKFFHKLEERITKEHLNIAGAPEGSHDWLNGIGSFNKGIFHMATICKQNIIPMFIYVPEESNPLVKYQYFKRGTIKIEMLPMIDTQNWKLEDLESNKEFVRSIYVNKYNSIHNTNVI